MNKSVKFKVIILCLIVVITLSGCVTEKTRNDIINKLENNGIIDKKWELIDVDEVSAAPIPDISCYDYIYNTGEFNINDTLKNKDGTYELGMDKGVEVITIHTKSAETNVYNVIHYNQADIQRKESEYDYNDNGVIDEDEKSVYYEVYTCGDIKDKYYVKYFNIGWFKILFFTDKDGSKIKLTY